MTSGVQEGSRARGIVPGSPTLACRSRSQRGERVRKTAPQVCLGKLDRTESWAQAFLASVGERDEGRAILAHELRSEQTVVGLVKELGGRLPVVGAVGRSEGDRELLGRER